jgi:peptidoglycan/xylan/chitin deacetylase (PgdA/CDA1 family)
MSRITTIRRLATVGAAVLLTAGCAQATSPGGATTPTPVPTASTSPSRPGGGPSTPPVIQATPTPASTGVPASLLGKDLEAIPTTQKIVALTFDAGANADGLSSILSTLSARHVPATFFLTGQWAAGYPSSVRTLVAGGYRLGNHTDSHPHLTTLSDAAISGQLTTARSKILAAGGTEPRPLFRFPYGDRNARTISLVNQAGYAAVRWTVDSLGWEGTSAGQSTTAVANRVVAAARPGEIVLMHVGSNPDDHTTLDTAALPSVIDRLRALGYGFVTLDTALTGATAPAGCDLLAWRTAPLTVTHNPAVPPVPVVTGIRPGTHPECRSDRGVLDIGGGTPSYQARFVPAVTADPSDRPVTVPGGGTAFLLVTLHPAQAHSVTATGTISTGSAALGYPMLKGYTVSGDYEGYVSVALGLAGVTTIRVGELPGRIYVDVSY